MAKKQEKLDLLSEDIFDRLKSYFNYHHTVPLEILSLIRFIDSLHCLAANENPGSE